MSDRRLALACGAAVAVLVLVALIVRGEPDREYTLGAAGAVEAARGDDEVRAHLALHPATRTEVNPLDDDLQRVSFFDQHRLVLDAAVAADGDVPHLTRRDPGQPPSGSQIAHSWPVWVLLAALFVGAAAGRPRLDWRTADAVALTAFLAAVYAYNEAFVAATVWLSAPLLAYLGLRCAVVALRGAEPAREAVLSAAAFRRLRMVTVAAGAVVAVVTLTSAGESDVAFASMAGATLVLDGISPYGNMPFEVVHGDTYPFLNYVVHTPAAAWLPVRDIFSDMTGALVVAALASFATAWAIFRTARRIWGDVVAWRHVLAWFAFPPALMASSSGSNDILLAAAIAWALALAAHGGRSTVALALGVWVKLTPIFVAPLWLARFRGAPLGRSLVALIAVSAASVGWLVALDGIGAIDAMGEALAFQSERGSLFSIWRQLDAAWLQWTAQAALAGSVAASAVLVARRDELGSDAVRLAGLAGAILLGVQLVANYWTFAYLPWVLPPLLIALFGGGAVNREGAPRPRASRDAPAG